MRPTRLRGVLYDWDGTLVDSASASFRCYRELFPRFGIGFDEQAFERTYSPDWYQTYVALGLPRERWREADQLWVDLYAREASQLVGGARELLARLSAAGVVQALVTSGDRTRVTHELRRHGVEDVFATVVCGDDTNNKKPHPEALQTALDRLALPSSQAVYIGDSPEDIEMARAAGVYAVGIPGGFPNHAALRRAGPDLLADSLEQAVRDLGLA